MSTAILDFGKRANMRRITNFPKLNNRSEFSWDDRMNIQLGLGVAAKRIFDEDAQNPISDAINKWALKKAGLVDWDFNQVGRGVLSKGDRCISRFSGCPH